MSWRGAMILKAIAGTLKRQSKIGGLQSFNTVRRRIDAPC